MISSSYTNCTIDRKIELIESFVIKVDAALLLLNDH